jgi:purine-binding chemotaxis protein CheW
VTRLRGGALATEEAWNRKAQLATSVVREYLNVHVGEEEYGIDIRRIREIIKVRAPTEVPRAPGFVLGVISVRGVVLPVIDLRMRLKLDGRTAWSAQARFLIVAREEELFGLLVDEVRHVVRLSDDAIEPPPMLAGMELDFIDGIGRTEQKMVILLNMDAILRFDVMKGHEARRERP